VLRLKKLKVDVAEKGVGKFSEYSGNAIRGAVGRALTRLFCVRGEPLCERGYCPRVNGCVYSTCFKPEAAFPRYCGSPPSPFVVEPFENGGRSFNITLFGYAVERADEFAAAAKTITRLNGAAVEVCAVSQVYDSVWRYGGTPSVSAVELDFVTPALFSKDNFTAEDMTFPFFMDNLLARISGIIDCFEDDPFSIEYGLVCRKPFIRTETDMQEVTIRQRGFDTGGFVGRTRFFGDLAPYMPYIDLGAQVHIGKKSTRGFGKYDLKFLWES
jgi:hypothetical protein